MLKRVYWVGDKKPGLLTAGAGFRETDDAPYERSVEVWEKGDDGWAYKGNQSPERQQQLESHPDIKAKLS
jgi:hypothetical protein